MRSYFPKSFFKKDGSLDWFFIIMSFSIILLLVYVFSTIILPDWRL